MFKKKLPKDENLQLIFSPGHDDWIEEKLLNAKRLMRNAVVVFVLSVSCLTGSVLFWNVLPLVELLLLITILTAVGIFGSAVALITGMRECFKYKKYLGDHDALKKKYNR